MLTVEQLRDIFPRAKQDHLDSVAQQAPQVLGRFGITDSRNRLHFFLAQIGHESGGLTIVEENLNYSAKRLMQVFPKRFPTQAAADQCAGKPETLGCTVYGGRLGNAALPSREGYIFRGRGYIQLTGRANYAAIGAAAGMPDLVDHPERAASAQHALLLAAAFWASRDINETADDDDFVACTRKVNGGTIGMVERRAWLAKVRRTLAEPPAKQPDALTVLAVQRALVTRGFREVGAPDGSIGRNTTAAIANFRDVNGLPPGLIDDALLDALGLDR